MWQSQDLNPGRCLQPLLSAAFSRSCWGMECLACSTGGIRDLTCTHTLALSGPWFLFQQGGRGLAPPARQCLPVRCWRWAGSCRGHSPCSARTMVNCCCWKILCFCHAHGTLYLIHHSTCSPGHGEAVQRKRRVLRSQGADGFPALGNGHSLHPHVAERRGPGRLCTCPREPQPAVRDTTRA